MSEVISFNNYRPPERFDDVPWTRAQIDEAPAATGPWTTIDTITFDDPDDDPSDPQARSFTTANGTAPDLWYRVTFLDGADGETEPTTPVQNTIPGSTPNRRDLCTLADIAERTPGYTIGDDEATDLALADFITTESRDFMEAAHREITSITDDDEDGSTRTFDVDWVVAEDREILIGDAAEILSVVLKSPDGQIVQTLDEDAWVLFPRVREDWEPVTSLYFPPVVAAPAGPAMLSGTAVCEVTARWGFPAIPDTVTRAVAVLAMVRYLNDAASVGTDFAEAANRGDLNLGAALRAALETRERFTVRSIGTSSISS